MITINDDSMGRQLVHPKDDIELRYVHALKSIVSRIPEISDSQSRHI